MQLRYTRFLAALRTAQDWLDANDQWLHKVNASPARSDLDAITAEIDKLSALQHRADCEAHHSRLVERALAEELRKNHLRRIVRIVAQKRAEDCTLRKVRLTPRHNTTESLADNAHAMLFVINAHRNVFDPYDPEMSQSLRKAIDEVRQAMLAKTRNFGVRAVCTRKIHQAVSEARKIVAVLDAMVRAETPVKNPMLEEWRGTMITVRRDVRGKLAAPKQLALPAPTLVQQPTGQLPAPREQTLLLSSGATPGRRGFGALVRQLLGLSSAA